MPLQINWTIIEGRTINTLVNIERENMFEKNSGMADSLVKFGVEMVAGTGRTLDELER